MIAELGSRFRLAVARARDRVSRRDLLASTNLASLVLGDLVLGVLAALLALAVGPACLWNVDLYHYVSDCPDSDVPSFCTALLASTPTSRAAYVL